MIQKYAKIMFKCLYKLLIQLSNLSIFLNKNTYTLLKNTYTIKMTQKKHRSFFFLKIDSNNIFTKITTKLRSLFFMTDESSFNP